MNTKPEFKDIEPKAATFVPTAAQVVSGIPIPPVSLLPILSDDDWEGFTEEWLSYHQNKGTYHSIRRYTGPGDLGLDVVAFTTGNGFGDVWDSFQCKQYDHALQPGDIYGEVGKLIYHSFNKTPPFNQAQRAPRRHVFVCPHGVGITVGRWLKDPERFKIEVRANWGSHCVPKIGKGIIAPLTGNLLKYFDEFDFSIFEDVTAVELIAEHAQTPFHAARFGGGLPLKSDPAPPPSEPVESESVYLRKLMDAYGDHLGGAVGHRDDLEPDLGVHYDRQRVLFYSAESLRNFARDRTPPRTFESLQEDIFNGVVDTCESAYIDALARLKSTVTTAGQVVPSGNALFSVSRVADRQGICHQLANDDRLTWVQNS